MHRKFMMRGASGGLVGVPAVATAKGQVETTVWFPKFPKKVVQGWSQGLKLSIRQPPPATKAVGRLRWEVVKYLSGYRWYQRYECFIGSRRWTVA
ncbi:MAG: hypothetical protein M3430_07765 [Acidobacteriota bacterium]|nr:hypothetical protein [Acidobacteriota bacterium]